MLSLKPDWTIVVPKTEGVPVTVYDLRKKDFTPPKAISILTTQERIFQAVLQGYTVTAEEHDTHTRIYITSPEEMARGRIAFAKEYLKNA